MVGPRERGHLLAHFVLQGRHRFSLQQGPRQPVLRVRVREAGAAVLGEGDAAPNRRLNLGDHV